MKSMKRFIKSAFPLLIIASVAAACSAPLSQSSAPAASAIPAGKGLLSVSIPHISPILQSLSTGAGAVYPGSRSVGRAFTVADRVRLELFRGATSLGSQSFTVSIDPNVSASAALSWAVDPGTGLTLQASVYNDLYDSGSTPEVIGTSQGFTVTEGAISPVTISCVPAATTALSYGSGSAAISLDTAWTQYPKLVPGSDLWFSFTPTDSIVAITATLANGSQAIPFGFVYDAQGNVVEPLNRTDGGASASTLPLPHVYGLTANDSYYLLVIDGGTGAPAQRSFSVAADAGADPATLTYKVTYDPNGSSSGAAPTDAATYRQGDSVTVLGNSGGLAKTGYKFSGWNSRPDGKGMDYFGGTSFAKGSSNTILYALWIDAAAVTWCYDSNWNDSVFKKIADDYATLHPTAKIKTIAIPASSYNASLEAAMQAGDPPDIFSSNQGYTLRGYAKAGLLKDINADLDAGAGAWRDSFASAALSTYASGGKTYGVPLNAGTFGFWYNKALFAQAGIAAPPATWSELLGDIVKLKNAGITPIALGEGDKWTGMHFYAYLVVRLGGVASIQAAISRSGKFTDAPFIDAGEKLRELIALSPFQDGFLTATYGDEAAAIGNGQAAMEMMGQWAENVQRDNSSNKQGLGSDLGWFPFPAVAGGTGDPSAANGGVGGFLIGKNASAEAIDFLKYLTSLPVQKTMAIDNIPAVKGAEAAMTDPLMVQIQQAVAAASGFQLYLDQDVPPAMGSVINDSTYGIYSGSLTPTQAAQAIENAAQLALQ
jgi:raffinose/stachyose/melibiose transport system substrate-binding protein